MVNSESLNFKRANKIIRQRFNYNKVVTMFNLNFKIDLTKINRSTT